MSLIFREHTNLHKSNRGLEMFKEIKTDATDHVVEDPCCWGCRLPHGPSVGPAHQQHPSVA